MADGQDDGEGGAFAQLGFDFDAAFVVFDDFLADGQAQAGAFGFAFSGGAFGGEEGLEDSGDELVGDAGAAVDHLNQNFGVGGIAEAFDGERAAAAEHGLAGVDQEIEEDLLELNGIAENLEIGLDLDAEGDAIFSGVAGHDQEGFIDEFLDGDFAEDGLAAGQAEHGLADFSGLVSALEGFAEGLSDQVHVGIFGLGRLEGELRVADDGGEEVVELVSDDGGDGADGGEALGFVQLGAERFQLRLQLSKPLGERIGKRRGRGGSRAHLGMHSFQFLSA